jgi:hypothetical protein
MTTLSPAAAFGPSPVSENLCSSHIPLRPKTPHSTSKHQANTYISKHCENLKDQDKPVPESDSEIAEEISKGQKITYLCLWQILIAQFLQCKRVMPKLI